METSKKKIPGATIPTCDCEEVIKDARNPTLSETPALILLVDDLKTNLLILRSVLSAENCRIESTSNGPDALEFVKAQLPDLILLDVMMPSMDGFEVCRILKADPRTASIPVIFLTAKTQTESVVEGFKIGGADYVTKPFKAGELLARVRNQLELKRIKDSQGRLITQLESALAEVQRLSGMIPICAKCKQIRDDQGYWKSVEAYISSLSEVTFSHSICPDCTKLLYPEISESAEKDG